MATSRAGGVQRKTGPNNGQFKKGDPRINRNGRKSVTRAEWSVKFNDLLAEELPPNEAVKVLIKAYKAGRPWAIQEVLERLMGKVTQPIDHGASTDGSLIIKVIQVGNDNGDSKDDGNNGQ